MYILFTSIFFAKLIFFFEMSKKWAKKISATTESNTDFLFCLLNGNFLDAAIAIYHDIHALGRRGYSLTIERIAGDFFHIAAICHLVNTCRIILNDVSKVFPDVSIYQIFLMGDNLMKKWLFGNSDKPLSMVLWQEKPKAKKWSSITLILSYLWAIV